jgi:hypothetical protein
LALKPQPTSPEREIKARQLIMDLHADISPRYYNLSLSKRYPSIRGTRTERYYDRPSLSDLMEMRNNGRVRNFLRKHRIAHEQAQEFAIRTYEELMTNTSLLQGVVDYDFGGDQFLVDSHKDGKLDLIMTDI